MQWKQTDIDPAKKGSKETKVYREGVYKCGMCGGTGTSRRGSICQSCKGKGVYDIEGAVIKCAFCRGTGRPSRGVELTCYVCRGSGWVKIVEPIEVCAHCRGSGAEPTNKLPCIVCKGKGYVTIKE